MNLKYGQKKKVNKTIGMNRRDKVETFWVPLYHAERFWSNAMELKVEISKSKKVIFSKLKIAQSPQNQHQEEAQEIH